MQKMFKRHLNLNCIEIFIGMEIYVPFEINKCLFHNDTTCDCKHHLRTSFLIVTILENLRLMKSSPLSSCSLNLCVSSLWGFFSGMNYIGCFRDRWRRDFSGSHLTEIRLNTPEECVNSCLARSTYYMIYIMLSYNRPKHVELLAALLVV